MDFRADRTGCKSTCSFFRRGGLSAWSADRSATASATGTWSGCRSSACSRSLLLPRRPVLDVGAQRRIGLILSSAFSAIRFDRTVPGNVGMIAGLFFGCVRHAAASALLSER
jgi:hypothetical protein